MKGDTKRRLIAMPLDHHPKGLTKHLVWSTDRRRRVVTELYRWSDGSFAIEVYDRRKGLCTDLVFLDAASLAALAQAAVESA